MALLSVATVAAWAPQASASPALLADALARAQGLAESYCRRALESAEREERVSLPAGAQWVPLRAYPVSAIASVALASLDGMAEPLDPADYVLAAEAGLLYLRRPLSSSPSSVCVRYAAGYTAATLPGSLAEALLRLVAWLLETRGDVGFSSTSQDGVSQVREPLEGGVPSSVARMLDAHRSGAAGP